MVERLRGDMKLAAERAAARPKPILLGFAPADAEAIVKDPAGKQAQVRGSWMALHDMWVHGCGGGACYCLLLPATILREPDG